MPDSLKRLGKFWRHFRALAHRHRLQLILAVRVTVSALGDGDVLRFGRAVLRYVEVAPRRRGEEVRRIPVGRLGRGYAPAGTAA